MTWLMSYYIQTVIDFKNLQILITIFKTSGIKLREQT
jgi:hypothetical protein